MTVAGAAWEEEKEKGAVQYSLWSWGNDFQMQLIATVPDCELLASYAMVGQKGQSSCDNPSADHPFNLLQSSKTILW